MPRLLVIDDRDQTVEMVHRQMPQFETVTRCDRRIPCQVCEERTRGCPLSCAHDYAEAAEALGRQPALPDLVVLDLHFALPEERLLPEDKSALPTEAKARRAALEQLRRRQGLLILEQLRASYPTLPVVMLTTTGSDLGAERPADPLVYLCENEVVDSRSLAAEILARAGAVAQRAGGADLLGAGAGHDRAAAAIETLVRSPLPLLVEGETGTGKSFLAEHVIHPRSGAKGPLVVTDLSTVPPALLAAHLFGARRGAYTGAVEDHPGVFEQAHGGTLFLDEIANLDLDLQRQLLLVLERGAVTRLGDTRPRPAAPKLVAATHEDVEALVREGRFRADLYMRLNPATRLRVPPLRERREDLPDLVRFALLEALRSEPLRPLARAYLARFPTPDDFADGGERRDVRPAPRRGCAPGCLLGLHQPRRRWSGSSPTTGRATTASCACWPPTRWSSRSPSISTRAPAATRRARPGGARGSRSAHARLLARRDHHQGPPLDGVRAAAALGGSTWRLRRRRASRDCRPTWSSSTCAPCSTPARATSSGWPASCWGRAGPPGRSICASTSSVCGCGICGETRG